MFEILCITISRINPLKNNFKFKFSLLVDEFHTKYLLLIYFILKIKQNRSLNSVSSLHNHESFQSEI